MYLAHIGIHGLEDWLIKTFHVMGECGDRVQVVGGWTLLLGCRGAIMVELLVDLGS